MVKIQNPQALATDKLKADLRAAYLLAFDNFSTDPVEVGNHLNRNSRYGRELLGILVDQAHLVNDTYVNGTADSHVWQCNDTYDSTDRAAAEATIDEWLNSKFQAEVADTKAASATKKKTKDTSNPAGLPACLCGCGEIANRGRNYRPGHDARHAGVVGRKYADSGDADLLLVLPTAALREKARKIAIKAVERNLRKPNLGRPTKVAKDERTVGTVKVGRWVYPAMKDAANGVVRNTKRDGSGEWVAATGTAFTASK
jgi:hypothetical protein